MQRRSLLAWSALTTWGALGVAADGAPPVRTRVETPLGSFVIAVDPGVAPLTVANYLAYVDGRHLDAAAVYRVVTLGNQPPEARHKIEVVQWGMHLPEGRSPPFPPIRLETTRETGLRHLDGTVSMARSTPDSGTAEYFICIGDQPALDFGGGRNPDGQGFAAFGQVVEGMDIVRALHARGEAEQFLKRPIPVLRVRRS